MTMNQNNTIPESVMNAFKEDAERFVCKKYPHIVINGKCTIDFKSGFVPTMIACDYDTYISGRQDEWVKQQAEIERLKLLLEASFYHQFISGTPTSSIDREWLTFKTKHNI